MKSYEYSFDQSLKRMADGVDTPILELKYMSLKDTVFRLLSVYGKDNLETKRQLEILQIKLNLDEPVRGVNPLGLPDQLH